MSGRRTDTRRVAARQGTATGPLFALLSALFLILLSSQGLAFIDLVSPENGLVSNQASTTFEYYPSMPVIQGCTLTVDSQTITDTTIQNNAFNVFTVVSIDEGSHTWRISCTNGTETEHSVIRTLLVDRTAPTMTVILPVQGSTTESDTLRLVAADSVSTTLQCEVSGDGLPPIPFTTTSGVDKSVTLGLTEEGSHLLRVICRDAATNNVTATRNFTYLPPPPPLTLALSTDSRAYGLGEPVLLTIDSIDGADVSVEVCPNLQGFVQCYTPLIGTEFPQTLTLPYTNRTGEYLVDGVATLGAQTTSASTSYLVENTMRAKIVSDKEPAVGRTVTLTASATNAIGQVTYRWVRHNGTVEQGSQLTVTYPAPGTYTQRVTATDANGNNASANHTVKLLPAYALTVETLDKVSGARIGDVSVQFDGGTKGTKTLKTGTDGKALFSLEQGTYSLFVSKEGYGYHLEELTVDKDAAVTVRLDPFDNVKPEVTVSEPAMGALLRPPVIVRFTVKDQSSTECRLSYAKAGDAWLEQAGTKTVAPGAASEFQLASLEEAAYTYLIECEDATGNIGESDERSFIVGQPREETVATEWDREDPLAIIDLAYGAYDAFTPDQRRFADLLGWEERIKEAKRTIERSARDIESLRFRQDLDDEGRRSKEAELQTRIDEATSALPMDIAIIDSSTKVSYLKDDELLALAPAIIAQKEYVFTPAQLVSYLKPVQQRFTKETTAARAKMIMADGVEVPIGVVSHAFTYDFAGTTGEAEKNADGIVFGGAVDGTYTVYESIPQGIAKKDSEIVFLNERKGIGVGPLAVEFGPEARITYYVRRDVPLDVLSGTSTLLLKRPSAADLESVTGNAILSFGVFDWKLSLLLTLAIALLFFAIRRADLLRHLKYLLYAESRKGALHSFRTLVSDGMAHLEGHDLEQATMRYKEAKLEYERLATFAKNEAFDDLIRFAAALDSGYFETLVDRISEAIGQGRLVDAIDDFERLEGTFELLGPEEQDRLVAVVMTIGRRLGLSPGGDAA